MYFAFGVLKMDRRTEIDSKSPAPAKNAKTLSPPLDPFLGRCRVFGVDVRGGAGIGRGLWYIYFERIIPSTHNKSSFATRSHHLEKRVSEYESIHGMQSLLITCTVPIQSENQAESSIGHLSKSTIYPIMQIQPKPNRKSEPKSQKINQESRYGFADA